MICYWSEHWPSLWFVTGENAVCYDQVYDLLLVRTLYVTTKFMICYWSELYVKTWCYDQVYDLNTYYEQVDDLLLAKLLRPSLWFVTGQNAVWTKFMICYWYVTTKFMICYWSVEQVDDLLLYVTTKFMICYWSERCMLRPSLWFVTGQNTVTTKFIICYWSERCMLQSSLWFVTGQNTMLRPSLWFVTGQNTVCYDQVYDFLLVRTLYVTTKFMICYWSERCMLRPSLWFVTGQNAICYDKL